VIASHRVQRRRRDFRLGHLVSSGKRLQAMQHERFDQIHSLAQRRQWQAAVLHTTQLVPDADSRVRVNTPLSRGLDGAKAIGIYQPLIKRRSISITSPTRQNRPSRRGKSWSMRTHDAIKRTTLRS
jgi:hypothetical protein